MKRKLILGVLLAALLSLPVATPAGQCGPDYPGKKPAIAACRALEPILGRAWVRACVDAVRACAKGRS